MLKLCQSLLILDESMGHTPVWRLAHQAVADFIETSTLCLYSLGHYECGKVCLMVLGDVFGGQSARSRSDQNQVSGADVCPCKTTPITITEFLAGDRLHMKLKSSLAEYATYAWPTHVRAQQHREVDNVAKLLRTVKTFLGQPEKGSVTYEKWLEHAFYGIGYYRPRLRWSIFATRPMPNLIEIENGMSPISLVCYLGLHSILTGWCDPSNLEGYYTDTSRWKPWSSHRMPPSVAETAKWSLVALACAHDETKILNKLLDLGSHLNAEDKEEVPPIVSAVAGGSVQSVKELLRRGADIHSPFGKDSHILHLALSSNSLEVTELLLDQRFTEPANVEQIMNRFGSESFGSAGAIGMLLDRGLNVNSSLLDGNLLAAAIFSGSADLVKRLLADGADVNTQFKGGGFRNALEAALSTKCRMYGPRLIALLLLEHGARFTNISIPSHWTNW